MAKLKISKTPSGNTGTGATRTDRYTGPETITSNGVTGHPGSVGGIYTQAGAQIHAQVNTGNGRTDGSLLRAKGEHKFLCTDGTTQKTCTLVNNNTLTSGQMNVPVYTGTFSGNIADTIGAQTYSYLHYQVSSLVGAAPTVGQVIHNVGQSITGTVTVTAINATVGGYGNVTIGFSSQDGDPPSGNYTMETGFYASKLTNRWVWDFGNDGHGYRNKYRYWSQSPTTANPYVVDKANGATGFVQIPDAA
jgi:ribosomal protein L27